MKGRSTASATRRKFLAGAASGGLGLVAQDAIAGPTTTSVASKRSAGRPRNVIMMVADGMSLGVPTLSDDFSRSLRGRPAAWSELLRHPDATHGLLKTRSRSSMVTDSAAAASAWGSGMSVNNGALNMLPDNSSRPTITQLAGERGYRTGLVTTDSITGATPAGFAANRPSRADYLEIAMQLLDRVDVLLGGGHVYFEAGNRPDKRDLLIEARAKGYSVCFNRHDLKNTNVDRLLGLFAEHALPYSIDWLHAERMWAEVPTLAEMTSVALLQLADRERGFFLMVEGARVDHAAHANDAGALLHEQIAFEDALACVAEFAEERGDTLVIATSDHGNGNPGLNGMGGFTYEKTNRCFERLLNSRGSFFEFRERVLKAAETSSPQAAAADVLQEVYGIEESIDVSEAVGLAIVREELPEELAILQRSWNGVLTQVLGNHTGVTFTGVNHTADHVILSALGPGASNFEGLMPHTAVFDRIDGMLSA